MQSGLRCYMRGINPGLTPEHTVPVDASPSMVLSALKEKAYNTLKPAGLPRRARRERAREMAKAKVNELKQEGWFSPEQVERRLIEQRLQAAGLVSGKITAPVQERRTPGGIIRAT